MLLGSSAVVRVKAPSGAIVSRRFKRDDVRAAGLRASRETEAPIVAADNKRRSDAAVAAVSLNGLDLFLCGLVATALGDFIMHPIDTIKVTQQSAKVAVDIVQTAKGIFAKGGILGFYSGVIPYCTADGLSGAIKFAAFELSKIFVEARIPIKYHPLAQFVCAAGAMQSFFW